MKRMLAILGAGIFLLAVSGSGQTPAGSAQPNPKKLDGYLAFPREISYQGLLTTGSGAPVADGSYTLQFDLYNVAAGGVSLWTETHPGVNVANGVFNVRLGSLTSLPNFFYQILYVEIAATAGPSIVGTVTFAPRVQLAATPYSLGPWMTQNYNIYYPYGNVGIGTDAPSEKLTLDGDNDQFFILSTAGGFADVDYKSGSDPVWAVGTGWSFSPHGKTDFYWYNNFLESMHLTPGGDLYVLKAVATDTVVATTFRYPTSQTGYISSSAYADGRALSSTSSYDFGGNGVYNSGATTMFYEIPMHLPDGVTLTSIDFYLNDAGNGDEASVSLFTHTLSTNGFSGVSGSSGVAFASGKITVTLSPDIVVDNSQKSYALQIILPATNQISYIGYRATYTTDGPGIAGASSARQALPEAGTDTGSQGPGNK